MKRDGNVQIGAAAGGHYHFNCSGWRNLMAAQRISRRPVLQKRQGFQAVFAAADVKVNHATGGKGRVQRGGRTRRLRGERQALPIEKLG